LPNCHVFAPLEMMSPVVGLFTKFQTFINVVKTHISVKYINFPLK